MSPFAEFNIRVDPEAARIVFDSRVKKVHGPWTSRPPWRSDPHDPIALSWLLDPGLFGMSQEQPR
ncbi:MAG TPA: hypothetical protein VMF68_03085 [Spirochaetia bacterium]|nr:hypothetical protein [Spirochaetia bacterium]